MNLLAFFKQYFEFFSSFVIRRAYASQSWCLHIQKCGQQHSKLKKKYCFKCMNINHEKVDYDVLQTARLTIWSTSFVISLWGLVLFWSTFSKSNAFVLSKALVNSSKNEKWKKKKKWNGRQLLEKKKKRLTVFVLQSFAFQFVGLMLGLFL